MRTKDEFQEFAENFFRTKSKISIRYSRDLLARHLGGFPYSRHGIVGGLAGGSLQRRAGQLTKYAEVHEQDHAVIGEPDAGSDRIPAQQELHPPRHQAGQLCGQGRDAVHDRLRYGLILLTCPCF